MNKFLALILLSVFSLSLKARPKKPVTVGTQDYGKIDTADLRLTSCDFEKDANAMVLFNSGETTYDSFGICTMYIHKRIKIFNKAGESEASIRIPYLEINQYDNLRHISAETINLTDNTITYIPVDKKLIYIEKTYKILKTVVIAFPNVKPGSVIEFEYKWRANSMFSRPNWIFQSNIPTRYSEYTYNSTLGIYANFKTNVSLPFVIDSNLSKKGSHFNLSHSWAMANVPSFRIEPFMSPLEDNTQSINPNFTMFSINIPFAFLNVFVPRSILHTDVTDSISFMKLNLLKNDDLKIAAIFDTVKKRVKWNYINYSQINRDSLIYTWYTKRGNCAEINLVLYNILRQAGIKSYVMKVSSPAHEFIDNISLKQLPFEKLVVYIPVDSTKYYILDASNKYNSYNKIPLDLLKLPGVIINAPDTNNVVILTDNGPAIQTVDVNAEIKPGGKIEGTSTITSYNYKKINELKSYEHLGQEKYKDSLTKSNNVRITLLQRENADIDSLPLIQNINFNLEGADENYVYFNANLFTALRNNPFLSETRNFDIDFLYRSYYTITGTCKIPSNYKIDALPKNKMLVMPDNSIIFKRLVAAQSDGIIQFRYSINFQKTFYLKSEYPELHEFYKKMYEMLNEQIVLKKS